MKITNIKTKRFFKYDISCELEKYIVYAYRVLKEINLKKVDYIDYIPMKFLQTLYVYHNHQQFSGVKQDSILNYLNKVAKKESILYLTDELHSLISDAGNIGLLEDNNYLDLTKKYCCQDVQKDIEY